MSITVIGILVIAALFFVVTMAIAVGPLLLCRLLAGGGRDECRPQPRRSSLASGVLTFCGVVIGVAVGLVVLRFALSSSPQRSTATVVHTLSEPAGYPVLEPEPGPFDGSVSLPGALPGGPAGRTRFAPAGRGCRALPVRAVAVSAPVTSVFILPRELRDCVGRADAAAADRFRDRSAGK